MKKNVFKNYYKAEDAICNAVLGLGEIVGINLDSPEMNVPDDLRKFIPIVEEAYFGDPHFIGGPGALHWIKTGGELEKIAARLADSTMELREVALSIKPDKATEMIKLMDDVIDWMNQKIEKDLERGAN